jgi:hypothetical protein
LQVETTFHLLQTQHLPRQVKAASERSSFLPLLVDPGRSWQLRGEGLGMLDRHRVEASRDRACGQLVEVEAWKSRSL